jgi:hypothetical protein
MTSALGRRYRSGVRNDWSIAGAFVLHLGPGTNIGYGRLEGRVEHVASTRSARFSSLEELLRALQTLLDEAGPVRDRKD